MAIYKKLNTYSRTHSYHHRSETKHPHLVVSPLNLPRLTSPSSFTCTSHLRTRAVLFVRFVVSHPPSLSSVDWKGRQDTTKVWIFTKQMSSLVIMEVGDAVAVTEDVESEDEFNCRDRKEAEEGIVAVAVGDWEGWCVGSSPSPPRGAATSSPPRLGFAPPDKDINTPRFRSTCDSVLGVDLLLILSLPSSTFSQQVGGYL